MYLIESFNEENKEDFEVFLKNFTTKYDEKIIKNMHVVRESSEIIASIAYQQMGVNGLVRYFIFDETVDYLIIQEMVDSLIEDAYKNNIKSLVVVLDNDKTAKVLQFLGFDLNKDEEEGKYLMIRNCA